MDKKKILYCESNKDGTIGGSYFSLLFLVQGIDKTVFEPIVVFYTEHALVPRYRDSGIDTRIMPPEKPFDWSSGRGTGAGLVDKLFSPVQKLLNFFKCLVLPIIKKTLFLKRNGIELVHLNNSITKNHDWMIASRILGIKCVTHERGINRHYSRISRLLSSGLGAVICISDAVMNNLVENGIPRTNLRRIYNGIDPSAVEVTRNAEAIREQFGIKTSDLVVGMVGNIKEWKGQEAVIRAVNIVRKEVPAIKCLLVGDTADSDTYYKQRLDLLIAEYGLVDSVIFTGYQSNVGDLINVMRIVIHASREPEPFGRVLIEAMAMKKPLIGARAGAVPEIILEQETGLTFKPDDEVELAHQMLILLGDPEKAVEMGAKGYQRLMSEFHLNKNIQDTMKLYREVLGL